MKGDSDETSDNPDQHQGRQRSVKHERGIWATFLYIPVPLADPIEDSQNRIKDYCHETLNLELETMENLHISVTKLLILKHHWIQSFVDTIAEKIKCLSPFKISFGEIEIYCNEERTRTFLGVKTLEVADLLELTGHLDVCLEEFKLSKYYKEPSFHMSIMWCLGDQSGILKSKKAELQDIYETVAAESNFQTFVNEVLCKCGNRSYKFPFR